MDAAYTRWEVVTGQPYAVHQRGLWTLAYWPVAATAVGVVQQYYTALPSPLTLATDAPGFPSRYHRALIDYALSVLWPQRGETAFALSAWGRYLGHEQGVQDYVSGRASMPMHRRVG